MSGLRDRGQIEQMFELLPDIYFYIKDRECRWVMCNQACLRLLNFRYQAEVVGATEKDFFPPKIAALIEQDDRTVIDTNHRIINRTELIVDESGHLTWVSTNKVPLAGADGEIKGLMGTTRVISRSEQLPDEYQQFSKVIDFIQANVAEKIDIKELAKISCLSDSHFRKRFRMQFRLSPQEFILRTRLQAASKMLISTDESIINVALACGFRDQSYFANQFKKFFEQSPKRYRATWGQK
ncbi:AraC family transcriptional regulator [Labrenzia sp. PHM005]|uniref:AraC family transcriptional regulator n=1 Tax=Stappiaceae TaxID=2821832 RepID=UPI001140564F|nr:AraC family transcriptional regulator [Labrenzia sp. PHM005]QDG78177.1 AraC family transcriptional regulator [Labrenzia sp. PHM005]